MFFSLKIFDLNFFTVKVFDLKFYYEKLKRNTLFIVQIQNHVINKKRILEISKFSKSKLLTTRKFQHIIIHANFRMFCQSSKLPIFKFFKRNYQNSYLNYLHLKFPKKRAQKKQNGISFFHRYLPPNISLEFMDTFVKLSLGDIYKKQLFLIIRFFNFYKNFWLILGIFFVYQNFKLDKKCLIKFLLF